MAEKEKVQELLEKLVQAILSAIGEGLAEKTLQPHYMRYFRWKPTKFEEKDNGTIDFGREGKEFLKPNWPTNDVFHKVCELDIYSDTGRAISEDYNLGEGQTNSYLHELITRLAANILARKVKTVADTTKHIDSFLKDLNGEKQACRAEVQLKGLILQPKSIKLDESVGLRKPKRKDFEEEELIYQAFSSSVTENPTAILNIKAHSKIETSQRVIRNEIDKAVAILRLFRVGAVQDIRHSGSTDSVIGFTAIGLTRGKLLGSADKYLVTRRDGKVLKRFWANMKKISLPDSVYSGQQKESDASSIAYQRYIDSLDTHLFEKRVSSAVMGLEALYLGEKPEERGEPRYKLSMRVAKLLSLIGYPSSEVRNKMRTAYDIRSAYVHGGTLKKKSTQEYERKHGDLNEFFKAIMDYLRASIVALLKRPNKNSLIILLDESLLDSNKDNEIKELLFIPYKRRKN